MKQKTKQQPTPLSDKLNEICRCGHIYGIHDSGAADEKACMRWNCKCRNYHKAIRQARQKTDWWCFWSDNV